MAASPSETSAGARQAGRHRTRLGAHGLIVAEGHILLARLSNLVVGAQGMWTLPGGGVEWAEHPSDALVREVAEEAGLTATVRSVAGVFSHVYQTTNADFDLLQFISIIHHVDVDRGPFEGGLTQETAGTTDRCEWIPLDAVSTLPLVELSTYALTLLR